jgi:hypothetical protein
LTVTNVYDIQKLADEFGLADLLAECSAFISAQPQSQSPPPDVFGQIAEMEERLAAEETFYALMASETTRIASGNQAALKKFTDFQSKFHQQFQSLQTRLTESDLLKQRALQSEIDRLRSTVDILRTQLADEQQRSRLFAEQIGQMRQALEANRRELIEIQKKHDTDIAALQSLVNAQTSPGGGFHPGFGRHFGAHPGFWGGPGHGFHHGGPPPAARLVGIPRGTTQEQIARLFGNFGLEHITIESFADGREPGSARIVFSSGRDLMEAARSMGQCQLNGMNSQLFLEGGPPGHGHPGRPR